MREAQLLSRLRHPNVIAYKESFLYDDDKTLCIVTAFAEDGDLFTHISRAKAARRYFPERQVLDWVAQIALALDHIHGMRVMHRDLKTQNIFLGRGGVIKLGDFGISRVLERTDDFATTVTGTPYYLSPEVCTNQPYTLKSDVWAFGCVAYEIATLRHAFAADSPPEPRVSDRQRHVSSHTQGEVRRPVRQDGRPVPGEGPPPPSRHRDRAAERVDAGAPEADAEGRAWQAEDRVGVAAEERQAQDGGEAAGRRPGLGRGQGRGVH